MSLSQILKFKCEEGEPGAGGAGGAGGEPGAGGAGGEISTENWRELIPAELKDDPSISKYTSFDALLKGHVNAVSMIGKDKLVMPETDEQWGDVYNRLGRPETAEGYNLEVPKGIEEDQQFDDNLSKALTSEMHSLGLSQKQAQGVQNFLYKLSTDAATNSAAVSRDLQEQAAQTLREEYGSNVDARVDTSLRVVRELGGEDALKEIDRDDLMQNPVLVKLFSSIADKVLEDPGIQGGAQGATRTSIKEQITETMADPAYLDRRHVNHNATVQRVYSLRQELAKLAS